MVFQDPYSTLNPVRTVGATLGEAIVAADEHVRDVRTAVAELLERVGLPAKYTEHKPQLLVDSIPSSDESWLGQAGEAVIESRS